MAKNYNGANLVDDLISAKNKVKADSSAQVATTKQIRNESNSAYAGNSDAMNYLKTRNNNIADTVNKYNDSLNKINANRAKNDAEMAAAKTTERYKQLVENYNQKANAVNSSSKVTARNADALGVRDRYDSSVRNAYKMRTDGLTLGGIQTQAQQNIDDTIRKYATITNSQLAKSNADIQTQMADLNSTITKAQTRMNAALQVINSATASASDKIKARTYYNQAQKEASDAQENYFSLLGASTNMLGHMGENAATLSLLNKDANRDLEYVRKNAGDDVGNQIRNMQNELDQMKRVDLDAPGSQDMYTDEQIKMIRDVQAHPEIYDQRLATLERANQTYTDRKLYVSMLSDKDINSMYGDMIDDYKLRDELEEQKSNYRKMADDALNQNNMPAYYLYNGQANKAANQQSEIDQRWSNVSEDERNAVIERSDVMGLIGEKRSTESIEAGRKFDFDKLGSWKPQTIDMSANYLAKVGYDTEPINELLGYMDSKEFKKQYGSNVADAFYAMVGEKRYDDAQKIFSYVERSLWNQRANEMLEWSTEHPIGAFAINTIAAPVKPVLGLAMAGETLASGESMQGTALDFSPVKQGAVSGMSQGLQNGLGWSPEVSDMVAGVAVSIAENAAQRFAFAGDTKAIAKTLRDRGLSDEAISTALKMNAWMPLAAMGTDAAATTFQDQVAQGNGIAQSLVYAAMVGGVEAWTENIGYDNFLDMQAGKLSSTFTKFLDNAAKSGSGVAGSITRSGLMNGVVSALGLASQMGAEGFEEATSELVDGALDLLINGERSQLYQNALTNMEDGMSSSEAWNKAWIDFNKQIGWSGLGGALSGFVFGGVETARSTIGTKFGYYRVGDAMLNSNATDNNWVEDYVTSGVENWDKTSNVYALASKIQTDMANGTLPSASQLGRLVMTMEADTIRAAEARANVNKAIEESEREGNVVSETAKTLMQSANMTAKDAIAASDVVAKILKLDNITANDVKKLPVRNKAAMDYIGQQIGATFNSRSTDGVRAEIRSAQETIRENNKTIEAAKKSGDILAEVAPYARQQMYQEQQASIDEMQQNAMDAARMNVAAERAQQDSNNATRAAGEIEQAVEQYANEQAQDQAQEQDQAQAQAQAQPEQTSEPAQDKVDRTSFASSYREFFPEATTKEVNAAYRMASAKYEKSGTAIMRGGNNEVLYYTDGGLQELNRSTVKEMLSDSLGRDATEQEVDAVMNSVESKVKAGTAYSIADLMEDVDTQNADVKYTAENPNKTVETMVSFLNKNIESDKIKSITVSYEPSLVENGAHVENDDGTVDIIINGNLRNLTIGKAAVDEDGNAVRNADGKIVADAKTVRKLSLQNSIIRTVFHELGHTGSLDSDVGFTDSVISAYKGAAGMTDKQVRAENQRLLEAYRDFAENNSDKLDVNDVDIEYAREEMACNMMGELAIEYNLAFKAAKQNPSVIQTIINGIENLMSKVRGNNRRTSAEKQFIAEGDEMLRMLNNAIGGTETTEANDTTEKTQNQKLSIDDLNSMTSKEIDDRYNELIESGADATAHRMIIDLANKAGYTIRGMHGTTQMFYEFKREFGNPEGNWGKGFYFTDNEEDVETNYESSDGADLTQRISTLAESMEYMDEYEDMDYDERVEAATAILDGGNNHVIDAALRMENPVVFGNNPDKGFKQTYFDYNEEYDEDTDEYGEPSGLLVDFMNSLTEVLEDEYYVPERVVAEITSAIYENVAYDDGSPAARLESVVRNAFRDSGAYDYIVDNDSGTYQGASAATEAFRMALENMGFDGIVDNNVGLKFGRMAGVDVDTTHYIVFNSNQIKMTDTKTYDDNGEIIPPSERFNSEKKDIRYSISDSFEDDLKAWLATDQKDANTYIYVGTTSDTLKSIGVLDKPIVWRGIGISSKMKKHKEMTFNIVKQVPNILEHPILIQKSQTVPTRLVIFGDVVDGRGIPVVVAIELQPRDKRENVLLDLNVINSAYAKDTKIQDFIMRGETLYIDGENNRAEVFLQNLRLQLPSDASHFGSIGSITYKNGAVNIHGVPGEKIFISNNVGYHAGDLGKAEPISQMESTRDSGHYGTGTYFVGDRQQLSTGEYAKRPVETIDFSKYRLFNAYDDATAEGLHDLLRLVNTHYMRPADAIQTEAEAHKKWNEIDSAMNDALTETTEYPTTTKEFPDEVLNMDFDDFAKWLKQNPDYSIQEPTERVFEIDRGAFADALSELQRYSRDEYEAGVDSVAKEFGIDIDAKTSSPLHVAMEFTDEALNRLVGEYESIFAEDYYGEFKNRGLFDDVSGYESMTSILRNNAEDWFGISPEKALEIIQRVGSEIESDTTPKNVADSASTRFMKALRYEGIDVRGTSMDNTFGGSVIYDLKDEDMDRKNAIGTARFSIPDSFSDYVNDDETENELRDGTRLLSVGESMRKATELRNRYDSSMPHRELATRLRQLYDYAGPAADMLASSLIDNDYSAFEGFSQASERLETMCDDLAEQLIDNQNYARSPDAKDLREQRLEIGRFFRSEKVYVNPQYVQSFINDAGYESWSEARRNNGKYLRTFSTNPSGAISLDRFIENFESAYPFLTTTDTNDPATKLSECIRRLNAMDSDADDMQTSLENEVDAHRDETVKDASKYLQDAVFERMNAEFKRIQKERNDALKRQAAAAEHEAKLAEARAQRLAREGNDTVGVRQARAEAAQQRDEAMGLALEAKSSEDIAVEATKDAGYKTKTAAEAMSDVGASITERVNEAKQARFEDKAPEDWLNDIVKRIMNQSGAGGKYTRKTYTSLVNTGIYTEAERQMDWLAENEWRYDRVTNKASVQSAQDRLNSDYLRWYDELPKKQGWDAVDLDTAYGIYTTLLSEARKSGDYSDASEWKHLIAMRLTQGGQLIQAQKKYAATSAGIEVEAENILDQTTIRAKGDSAELKRIHSENEDMRDKIDAQNKENARLTAERAKLIEQSQRLKEELDAQRKEGKALDRATEKLYDEVTKQLMDILALQRRIMQADDKADAIEFERDKLADQLNALIAEASDLDRKNANIVKEHARLSNYLNTRTEQSNRLAQENERLQNDIDSMKAQIEALRAANEEAKNVTLTGAKSVLEAKLNELESRRADAEERLKQANRDRDDTRETGIKARKATGSTARGTVARTSYNEYVQQASKDLLDNLKKSMKDDKRTRLLNDIHAFSDIVASADELYRASEAAKLDGGQQLANIYGMDIETARQNLINVILQAAETRNFRLSKRGERRTDGTADMSNPDNLKVTNRWIRKSLEKQDFEYINNLAKAQVANIAADYAGSTLGEKLSTIQYISQLMNFRTSARNITSNLAFYATEGGATNAIGSMIDSVTGRLTGNRTVATNLLRRGDTSSVLKSGIDNAGKARLEARLDSDAGYSDNKYAHSKRTFKMAQRGIAGAIARGFSTAEMINGYSLNVSDEFFKGMLYQRTMNNFASLVENGIMPQEDAEYLATKQMLYATFQDETFLGDMLNEAHDALNYETEWFAENDIPILKNLKGIGVGDMVVKYRGVPGALVMRAIEYSPLGSLKAVFNGVQLARYMSQYNAEMKNGDLADTDKIKELRQKALGFQRDWSLGVARSMTGSAMSFVFYLLSKAGLLKRDDEDDDKSVAAQNRAEGLNGTMINMDGFAALIESGIDGLFDGSFRYDWRDGDDLYDIGFMDPLASNITLGSMIAQNETNLMDILKQNTSMVGAAFGDLSMMQTINDMIQAYIYHDDNSDLTPMEEVGITLATSSLTSFMPSLVRQMAQALDENYRDAYGGGPIQDFFSGTDHEDFGAATQVAANQVMMNLPWLREMLPKKLDTFGNEKIYSDSAVRNAVNALLNPGRYSKYSRTDVSAELKRVYEATKAEGDPDASFYLATSAPKSAKFFSGEDALKITMTGDQRRQYQKTRGAVYESLVRELMGNDAYRTASTKQQAQWLSDAESYAEYKARQEIFASTGHGTYTNDDWNKTELGMGAGFSWTNIRKILDDTSETMMPSDVDEFGDTIQGSRENKMLDYIVGLGERYSDQQKVDLYGVLRGAGAESSVRKLQTIMDSGLSFSEAAAVRKLYNGLAAYGAENNLNEADNFMKGLNDMGLSKESIDVAMDNYKFFSQIPEAVNGTITKLTAHGVDFDTAYDLANEMKTVKDGEHGATRKKYDVIINSNLSTSEKQLAIASMGAAVYNEDEDDEDYGEYIGNKSAFGDIDTSVASRIMNIYSDTPDDSSNKTSILSMTPPTKYTENSVVHEFSDYASEQARTTYVEWMNKLDSEYLYSASTVTTAKNLAANAAKYEAVVADGGTPDLSSSTYSKYRRAMQAEDVGLDIAGYLNVCSTINGFTGDKDSSGKTISGSKKTKVVDYLKSLGLTTAQYNFFYSTVMGYK